MSEVGQGNYSKHALNSYKLRIVVPEVPPIKAEMVFRYRAIQAARFSSAIEKALGEMFSSKGHGSLNAIHPRKLVIEVECMGAIE